MRSGRWTPCPASSTRPTSGGSYGRVRVHERLGNIHNCASSGNGQGVRRHRELAARLVGGCAAPPRGQRRHDLGPARRACESAVLPESVRSWCDVADPRCPRSQHGDRRYAQRREREEAGGSAASASRGGAGRVAELEARRMAIPPVPFCSDAPLRGICGLMATRSATSAHLELPAVGNPKSARSRLSWG
jgi:hypothetical protein